MPSKKRSKPRNAARTRAWKANRVVIVETQSHDKLSLLRETLDQSGFWLRLKERTQQAGLPIDQLRILIKPDLETFDFNAPTGTDIELVEHLIDLLHDEGYTRVAVGSAADGWDKWLENRDVCVLADLVGYHYITPSQRPYDFLDLSEELVPVEFSREGALSGRSLSRAWVYAHFRINFAKNKTHEEFCFALALQNLLTVLPKADQEYLALIRVPQADVCLELLRICPPHFNLIDAFTSNHGSAGSREPHTIETRTLVASADTLLVDWAASLKMGIDAYASPVNAHSLREVGLPKDYEIAGSLAPYPGWINVPPLLVDSVRQRNEWAGFAHVATPWMQTINRELFPFKSVLDDQLNAFLTKYLSQPDSNPGVSAALMALNYSTAFAGRALEAYRINYSKEFLSWKETPLGFDTAAYTAADYEAVVAYMMPLQRIIAETPPEPNGLRWRYLDNSVLFEFSHLTPVPFRKFVARVDISRSVQSMNDYIGGACVPVLRDSKGKIIYQAERNIYLPQPNWMVLFSGKHIDVCKLEFIEYKPRSHKIFWRTVKSLNGSAEFDDGIVTFAAEGRDSTRVTIIARQKFTLPLFWQAVNMDLFPQIKNVLVVDAYTRYFRQTIANFEAQYQGRESRIGRLGGTQPAQPLEKLAEVFSKLGKSLNFGAVPGLLRGLGVEWQRSGAPGCTVDEDGFRHFPGGTAERTTSDGAFDLAMCFPQMRAETASFFTDLADAMRKDLRLAPEENRGKDLFPA
jgi:uncharacterized protein (DUF362 family)